VDLRLGATLSGQLGGSVRAAEFAPDGGRIVTGAFDGILRMWDPATGDEVGQVVHPSASDPREVLAATGAAPIPIWLVVNSPGSIAFSPDGARLAAGWGVSGILLLDLGTGDQVWLAVHDEHHRVAPEAVAFNGDGTLLGAVCADQVIRLWATDTGAEIRQSPLGDPFFNTRSTAFSTDLSLVAVTGVGRDMTVRLWNPLTDTTLGRLDGHRGPVGAVAMNAAGTQLATAGDDHTVRLWSAAAAVQQQVLHGHTAEVRDVRFSPAGALLASRGNDAVRLWDLDSGEQVGWLDDADRRYLNPLAFSPDGGRLAVACRDHTVEVWDLLPAVDEGPAGS
jgi:WD40 repeat protein